MAVTAKIALGEGAVSYGAKGLVAQVSSRAPERLVQEVGYAMLSGDVRTMLGAEVATTSRTAQIELGCLNNAFMIKQAKEVEKKPLSCSTTGSKTLNKSLNWSGSIETMQLDPVIMAMMTGQTIKTPTATDPISLVDEETLTSSAASVVTLTYVPTDIISVERVSDSGLHHETTAALAAADADGTFELVVAAKTLTFEDVTLNQTVSFKVKYRHLSTSGVLGLVIEGSNTSFPSSFDGWFSFLAVDPDNNATGRVIAEFKTAKFTSDFEMGGNVREFMSKVMEFDIEGDVSFYWEEFATT